ncbi:hypothetical protein FB451DRAFT_1376003 [Mycena latifolia]|nr:hypothetical protein FB451DRAFT_1376003 [Mycena latifolia]
MDSLPTKSLKPGVVNLPGETPASTALVADLVYEDFKTHHCFWNEGNFATLYPDCLAFFASKIAEHGVSDALERYVFSAEANSNGALMLAALPLARAWFQRAREGQSIFKLHYVTSDLARRQYSTPPERPTAQWSALHHRPGKAKARSQRLKVTQRGARKPEGARVYGRAKRIVYMTSGEGKGSLVLAWCGEKKCAGKSWTCLVDHVKAHGPFRRGVTLATFPSLRFFPPFVFIFTGLRHYDNICYSATANFSTVTDLLSPNAVVLRMPSMRPLPSASVGASGDVAGVCYGIDSY